MTSGCGSKDATGGEPTCLSTPANAACTDPLYPPTFENLFTETLFPTCSHSDLGGCHGGSNPEAGLKLDDIDTAYADLLATNAEGQRRVIPGDVSCGKVIVRLESVGDPWSMPPGDHLDDQTLCAIVQWIKKGAPGP